MQWKMWHSNPANAWNDITFSGFYSKRSSVQTEQNQAQVFILGLKTVLSHKNDQKVIKVSQT